MFSLSHGIKTVASSRFSIIICKSCVAFLKCSQLLQSRWGNGGGHTQDPGNAALFSSLSLCFATILILDMSHVHRDNRLVSIQNHELLRILSNIHERLYKTEHIIIINLKSVQVNSRSFI